MKLRTLFGAAALLFAAQAISIAAPAQQQFAAKQLFEGIMLSHGPVASFLGQNNNAWSARQAAAAGALEQKITASNPRFLASFGNAVTSGDPGRVSSALAGASREISRFATQVSAHNHLMGVLLDVTDASIHVNTNYVVIVAPSESIQINFPAYIDVLQTLATRSTFAHEALISKLATTLHH